MARIPYPELDKAHTKVREAYADLPAQLNVLRMMAHAERNYVPLLRLGGTILSRQKLSPKIRELAILFVASDAGARYEWIQHVPIAEQAGVTAQQIDAIERGSLEGACFDDEEKLALRFAREVVHQVRASDETLEQIQRLYSPREIVELILAIGYYMMLARLMETTGVDLEEAAGTTIPDALGH
jgi:alkylhydroperoxidase family enzyme